MSASLTFRSVSVSRGPRPILTDVDLVLAPGHRVGIVGPNGVGKSTLLAAAAGNVALDGGSVSMSPPGATIGLLAQEPDRTDELAFDFLRRRTGVTPADQELTAATQALADETAGAADRYDIALHRWLALGAADFDARVGVVADDLGLTERTLSQPRHTLSGGEAARVDLAALLLARFDVFLLDEPTNDLDLDGLARLEEWVLSIDAAVALVSHDRRFLRTVVTEVAEIDEFTHRVSTFGGGWQAYLDERSAARRHAQERYERFESERSALASRAQRQREWAQQGRAKVRRSANDEPDKNIRNFRLDQTEQLAGKAAQTQRAIDRLEVVDEPRESWELRLDIPDATRSGDIVARLSGVVVGRGEFRLGPVDLLVEFGERIAIVGRNGAGKSTLLDVMLGRREPDSGTAQLGSGVVVGEIEQVRSQLAQSATLVRSFIDATGMTVSDARTLLAKFGLAGEHVGRATSSLSPGERTRAAMALLMANGANLLVLDEPTNHLDLPAIEQLEQALDSFAGTVLVVSHDREFLDHLRVTRTIRLVDGRIVGSSGSTSVDAESP